MKQWCDAVLTLNVEQAKNYFPFADALTACLHDPVYHAEGDVWIHTKRVVDELVRHETFICADKEQQQILLFAAFLHDIAKPQTTVELWDETQKRIRISQPGHAKAGAKQSLDLLWHAGMEWPILEQVYWLIAWHQKPFHIWKATNMMKQAIEFSFLGNWSLLLALVEADNKGRISPNVEETATDLALLRQWLDENRLLETPYSFANDETRIVYFEKPNRYEGHVEFEQEIPVVHILCGLPGAGKDSYAKKYLGAFPVMSLDHIREELDIAPTANQGRVVQEALEQARKYLRAKKPFVWNAVNINRLNRARAVKLCRDYGFRVEIHALVPPADRLYWQNKEREKAVPEKVIKALAQKWEPPSLTEAHAVYWIK